MSSGVLHRSISRSDPEGPSERESRHCSLPCTVSPVPCAQFRSGPGWHWLAPHRHSRPVSESGNCHTTGCCSSPMALRNLETAVARPVDNHDGWPNRFQQLLFRDDLARVKQKPSRMSSWPPSSSTRLPFTRNSRLSSSNSQSANLPCVPYSSPVLRRIKPIAIQGSYHLFRILENFVRTPRRDSLQTTSSFGPR